jgi:uncharacterized protein (TIGR02996 family)
MSTTEEAFLSDIRANAEEDGVRLIYADWLQENGQGQRAEFIRVQVELARLSDDDPRRGVLADRQDELLAAHGDEWGRCCFEAGARQAEWSRGLVEEVDLERDDQVEDILRAAPVRRLRLSNVDGERLAQIVGLPQFAQVRELTAEPRYNTRLRADDLARSSRVAELTALSLGDLYPRPAHIEALFSSLHFRSLKRLALTSSHLGAEEVESLAQAPLLGQLTDLNLSDNEIELRGVEALLASPRVAGLTNLDLDGVGELGAEGGRAFAASPYLGRLAGLSLYWAGLGPEGVAALAAAAHLESLRRLYLNENGLGDEGVREIARAPHWTGLTDLNLALNLIGPEGVGHLARSPIWPNLEQVAFGDSELGDEGAKALADSPALALLSFASATLGPRGVRALAAKAFPHLKTLELSHSRIGDKGLGHLLSHGRFPRLTRLEVADNDLTADGIRALADSALLGHLTELDLSGNKIEDEGVTALVSSPRVTKLRRLNLASCGLGDAGVQALVSSPCLTRLRSLYLGFREVPGDSPAANALRLRFGHRVVL